MNVRINCDQSEKKKEWNGGREGGGEEWRRGAGDRDLDGISNVKT